MLALIRQPSDQLPPSHSHPRAPVGARTFRQSAFWSVAYKLHPQSNHYLNRHLLNTLDLYCKTLPLRTLQLASGAVSAEANHAPYRFNANDSRALSGHQQAEGSHSCFTPASLLSLGLPSRPGEPERSGWLHSKPSRTRSTCPRSLARRSRRHIQLGSRDHRSLLVHT